MVANGYTTCNKRIYTVTAQDIAATRIKSIKEDISQVEQET